MRGKSKREKEKGRGRWLRRSWDGYGDRGWLRRRKENEEYLDGYEDRGMVMEMTGMVVEIKNGMKRSGCLSWWNGCSKEHGCETVGCLYSIMGW